MAGADLLSGEIVFSPDDPDAAGHFNRMLREFYRQNRRPMPWRVNLSPYRVLVSEMMLQQTQVSRVTQKFPGFIAVFPDFQTLGVASLEDILRSWQGLGYNRRAKYLQAIARTVTDKWNGELPDDPAVLETLPGIGKATAGSIVTFTWNYPLVFIETNVRRVFLYHFFPGKDPVPDREIYPVIERMLDRSNPREWYYAVMDYGAFLSGRVSNPNRRSSHYAVQSPFGGSDRQVRGGIIRMLLSHGPMPREDLVRRCGTDETRSGDILSRMINEGILKDNSSIISFVEV
ncbi:MAG: A/G-specific adenine glycosylase [Methanospirillum sp.]|nr:A/G-specific adenine glycosylase [Methanospirillum sp.]